MSEPIFVISGAARREKKKELGQLKSFVKNFWRCEDVDRVYGGGMEDRECEKMIAVTNKKITELEKQLSKRL